MILLSGMVEITFDEAFEDTPEDWLEAESSEEYSSSSVSLSLRPTLALGNRLWPEQVATTVPEL